MNNLPQSDDVRKLCRICSGIGLFDIHKPIPIYLHSSPNEYNQWMTVIAELVEDLTGCVISKSDGLPQKICTVCISYLKHATTFRRQAIDNVNSLKIAKGLASKCFIVEEVNGFGGVNELDLSKQLAEDAKMTNFNKNLVNRETYENLKFELDQFFEYNDDNDDDDDDDDEDDDDEMDSDDNELANNGTRLSAAQLLMIKKQNTKTAIYNFFNYTEKQFEEDDISNFHGISVTSPADDFKERKCQACKRRFMLQESMVEHMKECIQSKLIAYIKNCQQLLIIKQHKAVSAQEFVRRMIFSLKSIVKSLAISYKVMTASNHPKQPDVCNEKSDKIILKNIFQLNEIDKNRINSPTAISNNQKTATKPSTYNVLKSPSPSDLPSHSIMNQLFSTPPSASTILNQSSQRTLQKKQNFVAKCPACQKSFDSIQALEAHNRKLHNKTAVSLSFNDYDNDGIIDVLKLRQKSPNVINIDMNDYRK